MTFFRIDTGIVAPNPYAHLKITDDHLDDIEFCECDGPRLDLTRCSLCGLPYYPTPASESKDQ